MIRKEVQTPIYCHGYSTFEDGRMIVFRQTSDDPTRVHPMQVWQTPFLGDLFAAMRGQVVHEHGVRSCAVHQLRTHLVTVERAQLAGVSHRRE